MSDDVYLQLVDGEVRPVDLSAMLRRHRASVVEARAGAIGEVADAAHCEALDLAAVIEAGDERIGVPATDAALGIVWELTVVEHRIGQ